MAWLHLNWPVVALIVVWVVAHLLIWVIVFWKRSEYGVGLIMIALMLVIYLVKPATYDLPKYSIFFDYGSLGVMGLESDDYGNYYLHDSDAGARTGDQPFCPFGASSPIDSIGFCLVAQSLGRILPSGELFYRIPSDRYVSDSFIGLIALIGLLAFLSMCRLEFGQPGKVELLVRVGSPMNLAIILGSVFFFVGSQNSVRQFLGIAFVLLALSNFNRGRTKSSVIMCTVGLLMHQWTWAIMLVGLLLRLVVGLINLALKTTQQQLESPPQINYGKLIMDYKKYIEKMRPQEETCISTPKS